MYETAFDIVALALRYWFVLIVAYILFRLVQNVALEFSSERTANKRAAGYALGLLEVVEPAGSPLVGRTFALRRESTIGSARKCDVRLQTKSVDALHAAIYQKGNKVFLSDYGTRLGVYLNGRRIRRDVPLADGDEIALGDVALLLHISGIEPAHRGDSYYYDDEDDGVAESNEEGEGEDEAEDENDSEEADWETDGDEAAENEDEYEDENEDEDDAQIEDERDDGLLIPREDGRMSYREKNPGKWDGYGDRRGQDDQW